MAEIRVTPRDAQSVLDRVDPGDTVVLTPAPTAPASGLPDVLAARTARSSFAANQARFSMALY